MSEAIRDRPGRVADPMQEFSRARIFVAAGKRLWMVSALACPACLHPFVLFRDSKHVILYRLLWLRAFRWPWPWQCGVRITRCALSHTKDTNEREAILRVFLRWIRSCRAFLAQAFGCATPRVLWQAVSVPVDVVPR